MKAPVDCKVTVSFKRCALISTSLTFMLGLPLLVFGQSHADWSVQDKPLADVVKDVAGSVVFLKTEEGSGSGFYINLNGDIVTARHVVTLKDGSTAKHISIVLSAPARVIQTNSFVDSELTISAHVITQDQEHDLALLRPETNPFLSARNSVSVDGTPAFKIGHSATLCPRGIPLRSGDPIFTVGHPLGDPREVTTRGIVASAEALKLDSSGKPNLTYFVDMLINPGNSGGPVFTSTGCVIGVADAVQLTAVNGLIPGSTPLPGVNLTVPGPDGKPLMKDGNVVTMTLEYSSGLGLLISQEYVFKMLDEIGFKSLR